MQLRFTYTELERMLQTASGSSVSLSYDYYETVKLVYRPSSFLIPNIEVKFHIVEVQAHSIRLAYDCSTMARIGVKMALSMVQQKLPEGMLSYTGDDITLSINAFDNDVMRAIRITDARLDLNEVVIKASV